MKKYNFPLTVPQIKLDTPQQLSVFQTIAYPVKINYPSIIIPTKCTILTNQFTNNIDTLSDKQFERFVTDIINECLH